MEESLSQLVQTLDANPAALCPPNRVFFFWWDIFFKFFLKKNVSLSVSVSLVVHTLWVFRGLNVFHQRKVVIMTKTRCYIEVL